MLFYFIILPLRRPIYHNLWCQSVAKSINSLRIALLDTPPLCSYLLLTSWFLNHLEATPPYLCNDPTTALSCRCSQPLLYTFCNSILKGTYLDWTLYPIKVLYEVPSSLLTRLVFTFCLFTLPFSSRSRNPRTKTFFKPWTPGHPHPLYSSPRANTLSPHFFSNFTKDIHR